MSGKPTQEPRKAPIPLVENVFAPETFASEAAFFSRSANMITVTFASLRYDHSTEPSVPKRIVVARVVMPAAAAQGLAAGLYDYLKKNGLDPVPLPADRQQIQ